MLSEFNLVTEKEFKIKLEQVINYKGLSYVLNAITEICEGKSQHLAENWQDEKTLAQQWDKTAAKLDEFRLNQDEKTAKMWGKTAAKIDKFRLSIENLCPLF